MLRVGINGFGRIGRALFRVNEGSRVFDIVAMNDLDPDIANHAYLLKYDSTYGRFDGAVLVEHSPAQLRVNGRSIAVHAEENMSPDEPVVFVVSRNAGSMTTINVKIEEAP